VSLCRFCGQVYSPPHVLRNTRYATNVYEAVAHLAALVELAPTLGGDAIILSRSKLDDLLNIAGQAAYWREAAVERECPPGTVLGVVEGLAPGTYRTTLTRDEDGTTVPLVITITGA